MSNEAITLSPNDLVKINALIRDVSETKTKVELFNESMKSSKKAMVDTMKESGLTASRLNIMIGLYHNNTQEEYFNEQSDIETLMENTFPDKQGSE